LLCAGLSKLHDSYRTEHVNASSIMCLSLKCDSFQHRKKESKSHRTTVYISRRKSSISQQKQEQERLRKTYA
jgi:hypothetical protein